ncbi:MAG: glycosyltransferase family 2 protein [Candidatus Omnitrophica bacterium]|nr:glycosyltransferase family 2 protein [Candidatus Omnitrophota bacterium]
MELPKFSFSLPVYNEEKRIGRCLESILSQDYPKEKIEILLVDGGSTDKTRDIGSKFKCVKILDNPKKLADFGVKISMLNATGDLFVIFAADNELASKDWLSSVATLFMEDPGLSAVWMRMICSEDDLPLNRYYTLIQSDPLSFFINKNLDYYLKYADIKLIYKKNVYIFYVLPERPLIWGANGLVYRTQKIRDIILQEGFIADNDVFQTMVESGSNKVAYFQELYIYHHHVKKISDWVKKWERNYLCHFLTKRQERNLNWIFTKNFKIRLLAWFIYSIIPICSLFDSIYKSIRYKTPYWLYHPTVNLVQLFTYIRLTLFSKEGINFIKDVFFKL